MANILIQIQRFNPETDDKPYMQDYEVSKDILTGMTIFDALAYIKDKLDPTLTYRAFCRSAICGSCAMKINNRAKLACKEQILFHVKNGKVVIKPLENAKIIRDLAVDVDEALDKLKQLKPWLEEDPKKVPDSTKSESLVLPQEFAQYDKLTDCILCMACYGSCSAKSVSDNYAGPFQFTKALRFIKDSRDGVDIDERIELCLDNGLWDCVQCQMCLAACPKGLTSADDIQELRRYAIACGDESTGAKRAVTWFRDVFATGQIDKYNLPVNAKGDIAKREELAKEFANRGISPDKFAPQPFEKIDEFRKFIRKVEEEVK
ncbi:MAG: succinate dehydrogenase/fumarate reductase iron-sulfur subunit [Epsilonproteobacteria bacterium]|nr:succinate dehydrogenase/fumarate reductase iron-sulfur subunit [Campylobacterota bacterium]